MQALLPGFQLLLVQFLPGPIAPRSLAAPHTQNRARDCLPGPSRGIRRGGAVGPSVLERGMHSAARTRRELKSCIPNSLWRTTRRAAQPRYRQKDLPRSRSLLRNSGRALRRHQKLMSRPFWVAGRATNRSIFFCVHSGVAQASRFVERLLVGALRDRFHQESRQAVGLRLPLQHANRDGRSHRAANPRR